MTNDKLRRQILHDAARLMCSRQEATAHQAKIRAARRLCKRWLKPSELPTDREVCAEVQRLSQTAGSAPRSQADPRPQGRTWEGEQGAAGSEADTSDDDVDEQELPADDERFDLYRSLLVPLETVQQNRNSHPEGDALYHSLQVFTLAREELPYDEELLLAALLHDVGKGIDPHDHERAGLNALDGYISERTAWLIERCTEARSLLDGSIGIRARRRLQGYENYDELLLLARCDRDGRVPGARVPELNEALDYIRSLATMYG